MDHLDCPPHTLSGADSGPLRVAQHQCTASIKCHRGAPWLGAPDTEGPRARPCRLCAVPGDLRPESCSMSAGFWWCQGHLLRSRPRHNAGRDAGDANITGTRSSSYLELRRRLGREFVSTAATTARCSLIPPTLPASRRGSTTSSTNGLPSSRPKPSNADAEVPAHHSLSAAARTDVSSRSPTTGRWSRWPTAGSIHT
jgi:hypothetical protein